MIRLPNLENLLAVGAATRYEQIAKAIYQAIEAGTLKPGDRLPTVRRLASDLGVSLTTVSAAFRWLAEEGWTRGEIGRGTFVAERGKQESAAAVQTVSVPRTVHRWQGGKAPWRKRAMMSLVDRLRSTFPDATDCSAGRPDPSLLPFKLIKRHWKSAIEDVSHGDLQYATVDPVPALAEILEKRLKSEGLPINGGDLVVGTSTQQFISLATEVVRRLGGATEPIFAVEQPGHYSFFDTWDRAGVGMIGVETDEHGAMPQSLETAIRGGANAVLLTPRAHNPTGASWTPERMRALGDVLSRYPDVLAIEDDHFGDIAQASAGSLLSDARIEERVIYIRSVSKSVAPDLRLCVAAARRRLKTVLQDAKSHADGWSSRLLQRVLVGVLRDEELAPWFARVQQIYRARRERVAEVFQRGSPGVVTRPGSDGVNVWIHLPAGLDANEVIERAAELGVLVAPGEVFYLSPGHSDVIRFNAGSVEIEQATACAGLLAKAIHQSPGARSTAIHV